MDTERTFIMKLRQELSLNYTIAKFDAIDIKDGYYYETSDRTLMDFFRALYSNTQHPVLVVHKDSRNIFYANPAAVTGSSSAELLHKNIDDEFDIIDSCYSEEPVAYINKEWLAKTETPFEWELESYVLIEFKNQSYVPDKETLESWKKMISVMLHRFRSPLTGISGYLELLQEENENPDHDSYFQSVSKGIHHLYDMMDELEVLYHIPSNYNDEKSASVKVKDIIQRTVLNYSPDLQKAIKVASIDEDLMVSCDPANLSRIFGILLENALEYSSGKENSIRLSVPEPNIIQVANDGSPIPDSISEHLFEPFVTSQADNLGIGLTMALLYAQPFGGTIFLSKNNMEEGIVFSICLPG